MAYDGIMGLATGLPGHQTTKTTKTTTPRRFKILCWQVTWCFANASCSIPRGILLKWSRCFFELPAGIGKRLQPSTAAAMCIQEIRSVFVPTSCSFLTGSSRKKTIWLGTCCFPLLCLNMFELRFWSCSYPQHIIAQLDRVHGYFIYFALQFSIFMKSRQIFTK